MTAPIEFDRCVLRTRSARHPPQLVHPPRQVGDDQGLAALLDLARPAQDARHQALELAVEIEDRQPMGFTFLFTNLFGSIAINDTWPTGVPGGLELYIQYWIEDVDGPLGFAASNAVKATTP